MGRRKSKSALVATTQELPKWSMAGHLNELRWRLMMYLGVYLWLAGTCMYYSEQLYVWIAMPLFMLYQQLDGGISGAHKLIFTGITEGFMTQMRLSLYSAFVMSLPVLLYQIYRFVSPGLYKNERRSIRIFLAASFMLFIMGLLLVYYFVMPAAWSFFLSFERDSSAVPIVLEARVSEYLDTAIGMMISFGLAFQLPIILAMLAKFNFITADLLTSKRRHAVVLIFIIAAIMTPPDVITQIALAIPLLFLYEASIIAVRRCMTPPHTNGE